MSRTVLGLKQQVVEIALTDEDTSPVYTLDMGDESIQAKSRELYDYYLANRDAIDKLAKTGKPEDEHAAAAFYQRIISALLGEQAFYEIVAYIRGTKATGTETADGILLLLTPVVVFLVNQVAEVLGSERARMREKYLGEPDGAPIL